MNLETYLDKYISYISDVKEYSKHTVNSYGSDIKAFINYLENKAITESNIKKYIQYLSENNYSSSTINRKISSIKSFTGWLYVIQNVKNMETKNIKSLKNSKQLPDVMSVTYLNKIIDDLSSGNEKLIPKNAKFTNCNINDEKVISDLIQSNKLDLLMHFAGFIQVEESVQNPEKYFENNTDNFDKKN